MMKFALFLVCALVAVQGIQARSLESDERGLGDIIQDIVNAVDKIKKIISQLAAQIPWVINHVKEKVTEILVKIPNLIIDIKRKSDQIIKDNGEAGRTCVDAKRTELQDLVRTGTNGIKGCLPKAGANFDELKVHIKDLIDHARSLSEGAIETVLDCVNDHKLNPIALVKCLSDEYTQLKADIAVLETETKALIAEGTAAAQKARIALTTCIDEVMTEAQTKENAIFDEINKCVAAA